MPSSEEESQWLVGSGLAPTGGSATKTGTGERGLSTRTGLYTEEMTTQPANVATAGVNAASADSAEHDLIDSTADATLLAQFHEDAIKQVRDASASDDTLNIPNREIGYVRPFQNIIVRYTIWNWKEIYKKRAMPGRY